MARRREIPRTDKAMPSQGSSFPVMKQANLLFRQYS
uniref:Uncharacterized protein n=1 Tax=Zea mays TaxID=4577 RepID=B7ZZ99_MAIZE|nr:unknown [Zea mays]